MALEALQLEAGRDIPHAPRVRTEEDAEVWNIMSRRITAAVDNCPWLPKVCEAGIRRWCAWGAPPTLDEINEWLEPTGWTASFVEGYVPVLDYQQLQCERIFPVTWGLRSLRHLEHSPWPDFIHDVIGHLPMMFDPGYSRLIQEWAERGLSAAPTAIDKQAADALGELTEARARPVVDQTELAERTQALIEAQQRVAEENSRFSRFATFYTWAVEFGFLKGHGEKPIWIGAAALSSPGEMMRILNGAVAFRPFRDGAVGHPVDYTRYQEMLFVADDWDEYLDALRQI